MSILVNLLVFALLSFSGADEQINIFEQTIIQIYESSQERQQAEQEAISDNKDNARDFEYFYNTEHWGQFNVPQPRVFLGGWHNGYSLGAGCAERYFFGEDGKFYYTANTMMGADRLRYMDGGWQYKNGSIILDVEREVWHEGGKEIEGSASMISDIEGGVYVRYQYDGNERKQITLPTGIYPYEPDEDENHYPEYIKNMMLGDNRYWALKSIGYVDSDETWDGNFFNNELEDDIEKYEYLYNFANWKTKHPSQLWGGWHADCVVGSGYSDRLLLEPDGSFYYDGNQMSGAQRSYYMDGEWEYKNKAIILTVKREKRIEGGKVVDGYASMVDDIDGGRNAYYSYTPAEYKTIRLPLKPPEIEEGEYGNGYQGIGFVHSGIEYSGGADDEIIANEFRHLDAYPCLGFGDTEYFRKNGIDYKEIKEYWQEVYDYVYAQRNDEADYEAFYNLSTWKTKHPSQLWGGWHDGVDLGAMYGGRYLFLDDGRFYYSASDYREEDPLRYMDGEWEYKYGSIELTIHRKVILEGGRLVEGGPSGFNRNEGGEYIKYVLEEKNHEKKSIKLNITPDKNVTRENMTSMEIDGKYFYSHGIAYHDLLEMWDDENSLFN